MRDALAVMTTAPVGSNTRMRTRPVWAISDPMIAKNAPVRRARRKFTALLYLALVSQLTAPAATALAVSRSNDQMYFSIAAAVCDSRVWQYFITIFSFAWPRIPARTIVSSS